MHLLLLALACTSAPEPTLPEQPTGAVPAIPERAAGPIALGRTTAGLTLDLPASSRPGGEAAPEAWHPVGRVEKGDLVGEVRIYRVPLPLHGDLMPTRQSGASSFGNYEPPGLTVSLGDKRLAFARHAHRAWGWGYDHNSLLIGVPTGEEPPTAEAITLRYPRATAKEASMAFSTAGLAAPAFALRSVTLDRTAYSGVLLPAPATATWRLTPPPAAVLTTRATILPPAIVGERRSDGATVVVTVQTETETVEAARETLDVDQWRRLRVDLSPWAGTEISLRITTEPGEHSDFDLAFFEEPTVYTPKQNPDRVLLVFVDTLRRDHLGTYGYSRDTSPKLDAWAKRATVFEQARTVAPWTLPSARATLSGHQPEAWFDVPSLPARLAEAGFHAEAIVANAYLSPTFDMHRGWSRYTYRHLQNVDKTTNAARRVFEEHPDRDVVVMMQLMEAHLPYSEPRPQRDRWAGDKPADLRSVSRFELSKLKGKEREFEAIREYVIARYDQNIRTVDEPVATLIEDLGAEATVVLFSDHGEEFWDHGKFEHGHSFYDELLRVPLIISDANLRRGRVPAPVSLLDVTPTVLALQGLPFEGVGSPLLDVAWQTEGSAEALNARPQGFGRPLYGVDGWAVLHDGLKWVARAGTEKVWDPAAGETNNLARRGELAAYPEALASALGRETPRVWRLTLSTRKSDAPISVTIQHPAGFEAAWSAYDPRATHEGVEVALVEGQVTITQQPGQVAPRIVYLQPTGDALEPAGLTVTVEGEGDPVVLEARSARLTDAPGRQRFLTGPKATWRPTVDLSWVPVPSGTEVSGYAPAMEEELKELGYLD